MTANLIQPGHELTHLLADEDVKVALMGFYNRSPKRQRQVKAWGWHEIERCLITAGNNIRATRARALPSVAYDTMARRGELVAMDVEKFTFMEDGSGRVIIRRSKTDQVGEGGVLRQKRVSGFR